MTPEQVEAILASNAKAIEANSNAIACLLYFLPYRIIILPDAFDIFIASLNYCSF